MVQDPARMAVCAAHFDADLKIIRVPMGRERVDAYRVGGSDRKG